MPVTYNSFSPTLSLVILVASSNEDESNDNLKPSYSKLARISVKQHKALEKIQNQLDRSNGMLGEELNRTKSLTDSH